MTTTLLERQVELRELLILPPSLSPPANKLESAAVGPLAGAAGPGSPRAAPSTMAGGRCGRWRGRSKRGRHDDVVVMTNNDGEHHLDKQNTAQPRRDYCKRRRKKQQSGTSMVVTSSAPDLFDGYQWRKYGQKLIEGAMYPRSYYRCTRSADQGCAAKRTVQRTDNGGGSTAAAAAAAPPKYTVVRMGEHTCTANDSPEAAPVILETTAAAGAFLRPHTASSAASCSTTPSNAAAGIGSSPAPAISDNALSTITAASSFVSDSFVDDYYGGLFAAVHDSDWVPALAASSPSSVPTIEDFAGRPIRSPVHVYAADGWTIDQLLLQQLVNEPTVCRI